MSSGNVDFESGINKIADLDRVKATKIEQFSDFQCALERFINDDVELPEEAWNFLTSKLVTAARKYFLAFEDIKDAVQEALLFTFGYLLKKYDISRGTQFSTFFYISINQLFMRMRHNLIKRQDNIPVVARITAERNSSATAECSLFISEQVIPDKKFFYDDESVEYWRNLLAHKRERDVFDRVMQDMSVAEIAQELDFTVAYIHKIIRDIKDIIRRKQ